MEDNKLSESGLVDNTHNKSKKRSAYDAFARSESSSTGGRGHEVGWARCPLCPKDSKKRFACGRGISAHLKSVHTPWNPSKSELRNREKLRRKLEWMKQQNFVEYEKLLSSLGGKIETRKSWTPTDDEVKEWGERVLVLTALADAQAMENKNDKETHKKSKKHCSQFNNSLGILSNGIKSGHDRNGNVSLSYRDSLPQFIKAASIGNLEGLKEMVSDISSSSATTTIVTSESGENDKISDLIFAKDRNGSTAEHWAAGGGHTDCLLYLLQLREDHPLKENSPQSIKFKKIRRRDGKTSLHYAARNGHVNCIRILLKRSDVNIDEKSGDGTTPLHMACYGGKLKAIQFLVENGANPKLSNAWGCNSSHWIAMSINTDHEEVMKACEFLYFKCGTPFHIIQKQGHSALHKAAQRKNIHVIKWMSKILKEGEKLVIGKEDDGGNLPSDILEKGGGDIDSIKWMREIGW